MPDFDLQVVDLVIIAVYIAGIIAIGVWVGRGAEDSAELSNEPWYRN